MFVTHFLFCFFSHSLPKALLEDGSYACPCCKNANIDMKAFKANLTDIANKFGQEEDKLQEIAHNKDLLQKSRTLLSDKLIPDLRDYHRIKDEVTNLDQNIQSQKVEVADLRSSLEKQQETVSEVQTEVDDLRDLIDTARRWQDDANRVAEKRLQIGQQKLDLTASVIDTSRDLRTVEQDLQRLMDTKDDLTNQINRLNREMTALNSQISQASIQVSFVCVCVCVCVWNLFFYHPR